MSRRGACNAMSGRTGRGKGEAYELPRMSVGEAMEQAAMVDRFNRLFPRTRRALRNFRWYAPQVTMQNAGQVNIGAR